LVHRGCEARVAAPTPPAAGNHHTLVGSRKVEHLLARLLVINNCPHRNLQHHVRALASRLVRTLAVTSALRLVLGVKSKVDQRVVAFAGFHNHVSALAPIPARRSAAWHIFFATKGHAAIAAVPGLYPNFSFIDKHWPAGRKSP